jgi:NitT/TauT family transport system substrate-binding protein
MKSCESLDRKLQQGSAMKLARRGTSSGERIPMTHLLASLLLAIAAGAPLAPSAGRADDTLKLAVGAPNNWDSGVPDIGKRAGIFKKHGLDLDILYTNGGGETLQAVISGSVDLGIGAGTSSVLGAFAKGAPVRILLAGATGAGDLYW